MFSRLHLLVLAPRLTKPYREEMQTLGVTPRQEKPGIWALEGGLMCHRTWLLETEALAGVEHPLLTLFSPQLLNQGTQTYAQLRQGGYTELVVYLAQQIQQFQHKGAEFAMQHLGTEEEMEQALFDVVASMLAEKRLSVPYVRKLMAALPPEERLAGLSAKDLLASLSPEMKEALRKQLQGDDAPAAAE